MSDTRGVFRLLDVVENKLEDTWVALDDVWTAPSPSGTPVRFSDGATPSPNTGYFGGGSPGPKSTMDKVTYATDTTVAVPGAALSSALSQLAATGNSTAGYFGGGFGSSVISTMDKVTYSSDTRSTVPTAALSAARYALAATGNSESGYFGGGSLLPGGTSNVSTMDKVTYSTDTTTAVPTAALSAARRLLTATGNLTAGYFGGGATPSSATIMDKVTYSTDTTAAVPGANLTVARAILAATGNSTAGYFGGGNPVTTLIDKITYSTDTTTAVPTAALSVGRLGLSATGSSTAGYFGGGGPGPTVYSTMDKVSYATDTTAAVSSAALSDPRSRLAASSATANALPVVEPPASTPTPQTATALGPTPNTGYFGGGLAPGGRRSTMDKVTYSTDTTAAVPGAELSAARSYLAATGNSTAGYFGGGSPGPTFVSTMDKTTYSSDTTAAVPGAALSVARAGSAATGNSTSGYFGGGYNTTLSPFQLSTMDKVTYSTDTTAEVPGAAVSAARFLMAATGNSTHGYFGGGRTPSAPGSFTTMDKVTYSSDTTAAVPGAALNATRYGLAATGNSTHGYFGGGRTPSARYSTMEKVTYSSDTTAEVPGAALSVGRSHLAATGNSTAGYFGGGSDASPKYSTMDKVTYASDTTAAVPGAALSVASYGPAASSARANALPTTAPTPAPVIV